MTTEDRGVIAEFDALPSNYFPGYVVTWNVDSDYRYSLHDLSTGEVTPLYAVQPCRATASPCMRRTAV